MDRRIARIAGERVTYILHETAFSWLQKRQVKTVSVAASGSKCQRVSETCGEQTRLMKVTAYLTVQAFLAPPGFLLELFRLPISR